jgi:hypothetical protein
MSHVVTVQYRVFITYSSATTLHHLASMGGGRSKAIAAPIQSILPDAVDDGRDPGERRAVEEANAKSHDAQQQQQQQQRRRRQGSDAAAAVAQELRDEGGEGVDAAGTIG